jgi:predicted O-methyltransferase YrrM
MLSHREAERLADLAQNNTVLEVGAHLGLSTIALASTAKHLFSVDWHRGDTQTTGWGFTLGKHVMNLIRYDVLDNVSVVCADSYKVGELLADQMFDLAFIDADHRYEKVLANIEVYRPKIKPGGIMCFHDYGLDFTGEKQAVDEVFGGPDEMAGTVAICHV